MQTFSFVQKSYCQQWPLEWEHHLSVNFFPWAQILLGWMYCIECRAQQRILTQVMLANDSQPNARWITNPLTWYKIAMLANKPPIIVWENEFKARIVQTDYCLFVALIMLGIKNVTSQWHRMLSRMNHQEDGRLELCIDKGEEDGWNIILDWQHAIAATVCLMKLSSQPILTSDQSINVEQDHDRSHGRLYIRQWHCSRLESRRIIWSMF